MVGRRKVRRHRPGHAGGEVVLHGGDKVRKERFRAAAEAEGSRIAHLLLTLAELFHAAGPASPTRVFVGAEPVSDQVQEAGRVPFGDETVLGSGCRPHVVSHFPEFLPGITGKAEVIRHVAGDHLLAVAPDAVHAADKALGRDVLPGPGRAVIQRVGLSCNGAHGAIADGRDVGIDDHGLHFRPGRLDVVAERGVLGAGEAKLALGIDLGLDGFPLRGSGVLLFDALEGAGHGAGAAPDLHEDRTGVVVQQHLLDEVGAGGVLGDVGLEGDVTLADHRFQRGGIGIGGVVFHQIGIHLLVGFHILVNEALALFPAPGGLRAQAHTGVLAALPHLRGFAVAFPVDLAAGVNEAFRVVISREQQITEKGVVVVQLRVAGDDNTGLDGLRLLLRAAGKHSGSQGHKGKETFHYSTVITVLR